MDDIISHLTEWYGIVGLVVVGLVIYIVLYRVFFKRVTDILLSLLGIIILSLPMLIISIIIKATSPGSVFFTQRRVGKKKKLFKILKFRTMRIDTPKDTPTHLLTNADSYITKIGKFLRKSSVDELPQLFNIFVGNMSIIGPRPALYNQEDLIAERDKYGANNVRPGLTGLAQISGRDELAIAVKAKTDGEYCAKINFFRDIKIFFLTVISVLKSDGVKEGKAESKSNTLEDDERVSETINTVSDLMPLETSGGDEMADLVFDENDDREEE